MSACIIQLFIFTYQFRSGHVRCVDSLARLLDSGRQLASLIQAEAIQCCTKLGMILGIICDARWFSNNITSKRL